MTGKELIKLLEKSGWSIDRTRGSHYIMIKSGLTLSVPVHGKKDLPAGLLNRLKKDGDLK